ncbi:MAG: inositol-3-phosphate synthase [Desulfobacterales bacterium]|nr:inositol-3-phosphate synthase [Desulfobacterales bacterium]
MTKRNDETSRSLLLLVAGAKGAVASTLAVAVAALQQQPESVLPGLMTADLFPYIGPPQAVHFAGWDKQPGTLLQSITSQGIIPEHLWKLSQTMIEEIPLQPAPSSDLGLAEQVELLQADIQRYKNNFPHALPVFINLLPAGFQTDLYRHVSLERLLAKADPVMCPDIAYLLAAIRCDVPVVNFTPNDLEVPVILDEAEKRGVPISGRDGKTGQTYLKVVLASALKARKLVVDGWYSLNILGNEDGRNLMDPERASGKMANKTEVLEEILGYPVGAKYGGSSHKVHIDYYPPRGDAKEAWDVIDFSGIFGLPMSLRLNLLGRDSVLAAPLVLDLARWMAALKLAGFAGPVPDLGFYFKKPVGENGPVTFQDQMMGLDRLRQACDQRLLGDSAINK